jgi:hypothetical protein
MWEGFGTATKMAMIQVPSPVSQSSGIAGGVVDCGLRLSIRPFCLSKPGTQPRARSSTFGSVFCFSKGRFIVSKTIRIVESVPMPWHIFLPNEITSIVINYGSEHEGKKTGKKKDTSATGKKPGNNF